MCQCFLLDEGISWLHSERGRGGAAAGPGAGPRAGGRNVAARAGAWRPGQPAPVFQQRASPEFTPIGYLSGFFGR